MSALVSIKCDCCKRRFFTTCAAIAPARAHAQAAGWRTRQRGGHSEDFCPVCAREVFAAAGGENGNGNGPAPAAAAAEFVQAQGRQ